MCGHWLRKAVLPIHSRYGRARCLQILAEGARLTRREAIAHSNPYKRVANVDEEFLVSFTADSSSKTRSALRAFALCSLRRAKPTSRSFLVVPF